MPRCWIPRLLTFKEAIDLEDLHQVKEDLLFARHCFNQLSARDYGPIYVGGHSRNEKNQTDFLDWCILVSGAIYYRRCFSKGVRRPVSRSQLSMSLTERSLAAHDYLLNIANRHIAHSVNDLEIGCTTIHVAQEADGSISRGGLGRQLSGIGPLGSAAVSDVIQLVDAVMENVIEPNIKLAEAAVRAVVDSMSDEELSSLPDRYLPRVAEPRVDRPRNWPRRK